MTCFLTLLCCIVFKMSEHTGKKKITIVVLTETVPINKFDGSWPRKYLVLPVPTLCILVDFRELQINLYFPCTVYISHCNRTAFRFYTLDLNAPS